MQGCSIGRSEKDIERRTINQRRNNQKTKLNERLIARGRLDADGKKNQTRLREHESYILDRESFKAFQAICCHSLLPSRFGRIGSCVARARIGRYVLAPRCLASDSTFLCLTIRSFALGDTGPSSWARIGWLRFRGKSKNRTGRQMCGSTC